MNTIDTTAETVAVMVSQLEAGGHFPIAATLSALDLKAREEGVRADFADEAYARIKAERDDLQARLERAIDLIRYTRTYLHQANLIDDDEYFHLCSDDKSVDRLHSYDAVRRQLTAAQARVQELENPDPMIHMRTKSLDVNRAARSWKENAKAYRKLARHLENLLHESQSREARLLDAIKWALGESDEGFRAREPDEGAYWWRKELRQRAALAQSLEQDGGAK